MYGNKNLCASGLVVKFSLAKAVPRVRFPPSAFFFFCYPQDMYIFLISSGLCSLPPFLYSSVHRGTAQKKCPYCSRSVLWRTDDFRTSQKQNVTVNTHSHEDIISARGIFFSPQAPLIITKLNGDRSGRRGGGFLKDSSYF